MSTSISDEQLSRALSTVKSLDSVPALTAACASQCDDHCLEIVSVWEQTVVEQGTTNTYERVHRLDNHLGLLCEAPAQLQEADSFTCHAPSLQHRAVFRAKRHQNREGGRTGDVARAHMLEIWSRSHLLQSHDLMSLELFEQPHLGGEFASFDWSADEQRFLFVVEAKRPPTQSWFQPAKSRATSDAVSVEARQSTQGAWYEEWGEQMVGRHHSVACVLDVEAASSDSFTLLITDYCRQQSVSVAEVCWADREGDQALVLVVHERPRRYGITFCTNRVTRVLLVSARANQLLSVVGRTADTTDTVTRRSLRVAPSMRSVVWLEHAAGGAHHKCFQIVQLSLEDTQPPPAPRVVLDIVRVACPVQGTQFAGVYCHSLPRQCWLSDTQIAFSTPRHSCLVCYLLDVTSGALKAVSHGGFRLLCVLPALLIGVSSSLASSDQLAVIPVQGDDTAPLAPLTHDHRRLAAVTVRHLCVSRDSLCDFSSILVHSAESGHTPLVMIPHGGPHSVSVDVWSAGVAVLVSLGFAVLLVNYHGSTGAGEDSLSCLLGRVGQLDTEDCMEAVRQTVADDPERFTESDVCLLGGSHGGFIVTNISERFPAFSRAVVARNPVCNLATMVSGTDIPDWTFVEAGISKSGLDTVLDCGIMEKMYNHRHDQVLTPRTPYLLMIGSKDLRVPPYEGINYFYWLREKGVECDLRMYDDNHSLSKTNNHTDATIQTVLWFWRHTSHSA